MDPALPPADLIVDHLMPRVAALQGGPAYYVFKNGWTNTNGGVSIPGLPLAKAIKAIQATPSYEIEFVPITVK